MDYKHFQGWERVWVLGVNKVKVTSALPTRTNWLCSIHSPSEPVIHSGYPAGHVSEDRAHFGGVVECVCVGGGSLILLCLFLN